MHTRPAVALFSCMVALTLLAACGASPQGTQTGGADVDAQETTTPTDPPADGSSQDTAGLDALAAELDGLDLPARRDKLISMAKDEGGAVSVYGSTNYETMSPVFDLFQEQTGVAVDFYRASSPTVLTRVLQEAEADSSEADVVILNGVEMLAMTDEGLAMVADTPVTGDLIDSAVNDTWFGFYVIAYTAGWNTDLIDTPPTTWEEVLTDYPGQLALQAGDWDWFGTLVNHHFTTERGMSEEEAVDLVRGAAREASQIVQGHTLMAQFLAAGEYGLAAPNYAVNHRRFEAEGAPVKWEPPVEPLVLRTDGITIHRDTQRPATALLLVEFLLTDAQELLPGLGRIPVSTAVEGGLPPEYETIALPEDVIRERDKWESLYEQILMESGKEAVSS